MRPEHWFDFSCHFRSHSWALFPVCDGEKNFGRSNLQSAGASVGVHTFESSGSSLGNPLGSFSMK